MVQVFQLLRQALALRQDIIYGGTIFALQCAQLRQALFDLSESNRIKFDPRGVIAESTPRFLHLIQGGAQLLSHGLEDGVDGARLIERGDYAPESFDDGILSCIEQLATSLRDLQ